MRYVIFRDDDTNALTPVDCLERLYRPFLDSGLPVNLATIPEVSMDAAMADGSPEGFLPRAAPSAAQGGKNQTASSQSQGSQATAGAADRQESPAPAQGAGQSDSSTDRRVPLASNQRLVSYLRANSGYHIAQHGCHHEYLEFDRLDLSGISQRLKRGTERLIEAGFARPQTFVAPYDRLSRPALQQVARRFRVLSTGWFELSRLPYSWWPQYAVKKLSHSPHWRVGNTLLLTHPGCLLSCQRSFSTMLGGIIHFLENQQLTVLVTHWWEYFRNGKPDEDFIGFLHETGNFVATHPQLKALSFDDLVNGNVPLN
ncbi:MAG TPA: DUF2334 domain-containing protein [Verrucomicrobiae bacterium]|nr:DUF2334 domain-containing protein [Verrucomicrobiae bacterium]